MSIRVAVIGAGAAGLCAVRHLASRPSVFTVVAFEQSSSVGGTWVYNEDTGKDIHGLPIHSSMYKNLKTNLPKEVMAFPDFPFDKKLPSFITHSDVKDYLQKYAVNFNVPQHVKFETQVINVEPVPCNSEMSTTGQDHKWRVTTAPVSDTAHAVTQEYDAVIVCNGHYAVPLIPTLPGLDTFRGEIMHSHNYRKPEYFKDRTVLCLGAAASGQDICIDMSSHAKRVYLCHNKAEIQSPLPTNVEQKPGIDSVQGSTVTLLGGEEVEVDCIFLCTGYHFHFPFLSPDCGLSTQGERVTPLYKHLIHTHLPTLSIVGVCKTICPFPHFHVQVMLVLAVLEGSHRLPSREAMDANTETDFRRRLADGLPKRYAHHMGNRQWAYNDEIAGMAGCLPIPKAVKKLYDAVHETRVKNLVGYKGKNYRMIDEEHFQAVSSEGGIS